MRSSGGGEPARPRADDPDDGSDEGQQSLRPVGRADDEDVDLGVELVCREKRLALDEVGRREQRVEAAQRVVQQVVRAAVQRGRRHDVRAGAGQRGDGFRRAVQQGVPASPRPHHPGGGEALLPIGFEVFCTVGIPAQVVDVHRDNSFSGR